jgi:hypothetical protein
MASLHNTEIHRRLYVKHFAIWFMLKETEWQITYDYAGPCHSSGDYSPASRVRAQVRSCGIFGGQSGTGAGFLRGLRFHLPILIPPIAPHSSSFIRVCNNRPIRGRRAKWTQSHPTLRNYDYAVSGCKYRILKRLVAGFPPQRSRVRNRTWSCGICGGTKWRWGRFSPSTSVPPAIVVRSTNYSTITLMYHPGNVQ